MSSVSVTMPRWPAYLMGAFAIACAVPAMTAPAPEAPAEDPAATARQPLDGADRPSEAPTIRPPG